MTFAATRAEVLCLAGAPRCPFITLYCFCSLFFSALMSVLPRNGRSPSPGTDWQAGNFTSAFFSLVKAVLRLQINSWGLGWCWQPQSPGVSGTQGSNTQGEEKVDLESPPSLSLG